MTHSNPHLASLEEFLRETVKANYYLTFDDLDPEQVVDQITTQLSNNLFEWVDNTVYVPNLLTVYVPGGSPDKMEEFEVIFNSVVFMKYLYEYMTESGYKLFDFVKVEVEPFQKDTDQRVELRFYWPAPEEVREDFTVLLNETGGKIVEVYTPKAEIPRLARLNALNAQTYRVNYVITKRITYIGRLRNIIDKETSHMLRRNDFVFARDPDPSSISNSVSRLHAKIIFMEDQFFLFDTGSANGTSITRDGKTIELPRAESRGEVLEDGDILNFGSAQVGFQFISHEEADGLALLPSPKIFDDIGDSDDTTHRTIDRAQIKAEIEKIKNS
jgi:hypothetical protein